MKYYNNTPFVVLQIVQFTQIHSTVTLNTEKLSVFSSQNVQRYSMVSEVDTYR